MNRPIFFITLLCVLAQLAPAAAPTPPPKDIINQERLARVFLLLTNARQMATGGILPDEADTIRTAGTLPYGNLKKECLNLVDACLAALPSIPREQRPDTFAYMKNAKARLFYDREDPQGGHTTWARGAGPQKTNAATRELADEIKKALTKL
jgi:hypothetical protein